MRHLGQRERKKRAAAGLPPKGCMAVRVGQEGEEQRRFVVPIAHLSHPLFAEFLDEAAAEYGFSQPGAISIPCGVDYFRHVDDVIDRERAGSAVHHHHLPLRLLHFAGCFGALKIVPGTVREAPLLVFLFAFFERSSEALDLAKPTTPQALQPWRSVDDGVTSKLEARPP
ncbi:hypothetical protein OPV22_003906 [Ensete ventricosum]|uniref:Auxin-responsive protein SAUR32 n=1 Tax=Ensete ventricosum TaxID=4639 RepID=A0AAV8S288_ENSVE|nr:hypothetical protein OPV22_003906 [Ensete ventricosum]